jgi:hypothetical protein
LALSEIKPSLPNAIAGLKHFFYFFSFSREFFQRLRKMLKIMIPSVWSIEAGLLSLHTVTLMIRTFLSIYVATLEGKMVKFIVRRDAKTFILLMLRLLKPNWVEK